MADLTDEERVKQVLGTVEEETPAETTKEPDTQSEEEEKTEDENDQVAEEKSDLESEEAAIAESTEEKTEPESKTKSFTKQFPNLKGETPEEYVPNLEKAYQNSFTEALRLKKELDDSKPLIEEARKVLAGVQTVPPPVTPENPQVPAPNNPLLLAIEAHPAIQYAKAKQNEDMFAAFDTFAKQYPQARDEDSFAAFQKASNGINQAMTDTLGRVPTYGELFKAIAGSLDWTPAQAAARKDAALKEGASSSQVVSTTHPAPKVPKVPEKSVDAYMKMFTSKTREEAIKDLSTVV